MNRFDAITDKLGMSPGAAISLSVRFKEAFYEAVFRGQELQSDRLNIYAEPGNDGVTKDSIESAEKGLSTIRLRGMILKNVAAILMSRCHQYERDYDRAVKKKKMQFGENSSGEALYRYAVHFVVGEAAQPRVLYVVARNHDDASLEAEKVLDVLRSGGTFASIGEVEVAVNQS